MLAWLREPGRDPEAARARLVRLRAALSGLPDDVAVATMLAFLQTGEDASTGLPFVVGPEGVMASVPTLRTFLLDLLPSLDPEAALENARALLARRESADEFALALRNLAWNDLGGDLRPELERNFQQMLAMDAWRDHLTPGFLEAFDIAVELGDAARFDAMTSVADEAMAAGNETLSRAAFMALDRMTLRDPDLLVDALARRPGWLSQAPLQRASLVARLDITRPAERDAFVAYLMRPQPAVGELEYLARLFPNGNYLTGNRLVTSPETTPTIEERLELDRGMLREFEILVPRLPVERADVVGKIRERLVRLANP